MVMIRNKCKGNEERKQRQANQPNRPKESETKMGERKRGGRIKAVQNEKKTNEYTSVDMSLICHIFLIDFSLFKAS